MEFRHVLNVYFRWCIAMRQRKVQGFCGKTAKTLALEQRKTALKALAFKGFCVVQYTLYSVLAAVSVCPTAYEIFEGLKARHGFDAYKRNLMKKRYQQKVGFPFGDDRFLPMSSDCPCRENEEETDYEERR